MLLPPYRDQLSQIFVNVYCKIMLLVNIRFYLNWLSVLNVAKHLCLGR
jgi:hypothetical protein